jgi:uncharacterized membrane protein YdbT with pleckstrin-like domain
LSYLEKNLIAGETVLYETRLHWTVLFWWVVIGLLFSVPGLALLIRAIATLDDKSSSSGAMAAAGFVLLLVGAALIAFGVLMRNATEMAVTNKRVIIKTGLVTRKTVELLLSKIESIGVNESVWGRMLGYGTVLLRGTGGTPEPFDRVAHPLEFKRQVQQQIEKLQEQRPRPSSSTALIP